MTALRVLACGPGASVQDGGRFGYRRYGVSTSGAMDRFALAVANALVGNPADCAAVELPFLGARLEVLEGPVLVAAFGASASLEVSGRPVGPAISLQAQSGDEIRVGSARDGVYAYLAVAGGFLTQSDLDSRSCHRRSGLGGQTLAAGDLLCCDTADASARRYSAPADRAEPVFRVVRGPQSEMFGPDTLEEMLVTPYRISPKSDRMALRLDGGRLGSLAGHDIVSDGVVPGSIQVPGDGQPIVLMRDCQTTGGYPKIATVISADLDRLAQMPPGQEIRFRLVSVPEAQEAARNAFKAIQSIPDALLTAPRIPADLLSYNLIGGVTRGDDL